MSSEERDDLNPEADVEGHGSKYKAVDDGGDDVEGHASTRQANEEATDDDTDDDVEAHASKAR